MNMQVLQIDAWNGPDGWTYNNVIPICTIEVNGMPTPRKILRALRDKGLIREKVRYNVDDYFVFEGTWLVQARNGMPLYDLVEMK